MLLSMTSGQKSLSQWTKCKRRHLLLQGVLLKKNMRYDMDVVLVAWYWLVQHLASYFPESTNISGRGVGAVVPKMQVQSSCHVALKIIEHTELMLSSLFFAVKFSMKTRAFGAGSLLR